MDLEWCPENDSEGEDTDISSLSQDSDDDSDQDEVEGGNTINGGQKSELYHSQLSSELPKRARKRRRWNKDIPFSLKSHRMKNPQHQPLTNISHSYPVPSLRREDAGIFNSHQSPPFTTYSAVPRTSPIPKFTLSHLRSSNTTTNASPSTHRIPLPQRLASRVSSSKTPTSPSSPCSTSPSSLPSAFRSRSKPDQEGETNRTKKRVLLRLENNVIVQPTSSYEELPGIDSSPIRFLRSSEPPHVDPLIMPPNPKPEVTSSDSENNDSPPASLLVELRSPRSKLALQGSPRLPVDAHGSPDSPSDVPNTPAPEPDSVSAKAFDLKHPRYFSLRTAEEEKQKVENPFLRTAPKKVPNRPQAPTKAGPGAGLGLKAGDKRESSSSLASETPALKHSKSSMYSTDGVFFFDEDIDRYQGSGPDDNDGAMLMMRAHQRKKESADAQKTSPEPSTKN